MEHCSAAGHPARKNPAVRPQLFVTAFCPGILVFSNNGIRMDIKGKNYIARAHMVHHIFFHCERVMRVVVWRKIK